MTEPESLFAGADTPTELLGLLAGAASVCWSNPGGAGVFDSEQASSLIDAAVARLIELGWESRAR
jgi:hypothetical protein